MVPPFFPDAATSGSIRRHGPVRAMPYTLITVVTPARPTLALAISACDSQAHSHTHPASASTKPDSLRWLRVATLPVRSLDALHFLPIIGAAGGPVKSSLSLSGQTSSGARASRVERGLAPPLRAPVSRWRVLSGREPAASERPRYSGFPRVIARSARGLALPRRRAPAAAG